ncbi:MAG: hypothetical protein WD595_06500 [Waddliaceae bacterium]
MEKLEILSDKIKEKGDEIKKATIEKIASFQHIRILNHKVFASRILREQNYQKYKEYITLCKQEIELDLQFYNACMQLVEDSDLNTSDKAEFRKGIQTARKQKLDNDQIHCTLLYCYSLLLDLYKYLDSIEGEFSLNDDEQLVFSNEKYASLFNKQIESIQMLISLHKESNSQNFDRNTTQYNQLMPTILKYKSKIDAVTNSFDLECENINFSFTSEMDLFDERVRSAYREQITQFQKVLTTYQKQKENLVKQYENCIVEQVQNFSGREGFLKGFYAKLEELNVENHWAKQKNQLLNVYLELYDFLDRVDGLYIFDDEGYMTFYSEEEADDYRFLLNKLDVIKSDVARLEEL